MRARRDYVLPGDLVQMSPIDGEDDRVGIVLATSDEHDNELIAKGGARIPWTVSVLWCKLGCMTYVGLSQVLKLRFILSAR